MALQSFALAWLFALPLRAQEPTAEAERIYAEGESAYNSGEYAAAAAAFERAYRLSGVAELMFDIGQAHRLAGPTHCEPARRSYAAYLTAFPDSKQRELVEQYLSELGACPEPATTVSTAPPPVAKPSPTLPAATTERAPRPVWPLIVAGAGATVAVGGAAVWVRSHMKYEEVKGTCPCPPGSFDGWERMTYAGYALVAVGVAASATGLVLWQVSADDSARVMLGPTGLLLVGHL